MSELKIIKKHKDYSSVEEASIFYEKKRMHELATSLFPEDEYPEGFKENLIELMVYQNPVQMNVWHNKNVIIRSDNGEKIATTWDNMCTFSRKFSCAEMFQCVEVLKRATPEEMRYYKELSNFHSFRDKIIKENNNKIDSNTKILLRYFNEIAYPELLSIVSKIEQVLFEIEEQICKPIRDKINADLKIMHQLPLGSQVVFIKPRERKM